VIPKYERTVAYIHRCLAFTPSHLWFDPMGKRILIVDDSASIRHLVRVFLEVQSDLDVCGEAADGMEGIEQAMALKPDLIVLDLAMPRMGGLEAARALQQSMPKVPIILFTFFDSDTLRSEASLAGITSVISKTGPMADLRDEVRRLAVLAAA
jgi:DNA-binding NarL/FixJ family response regulator